MRISVFWLSVASSTHAHPFFARAVFDSLRKVLLARKSREPERKITIRRYAGAEPSSAVASNVAAALPTILSSESDGDTGSGNSSSGRSSTDGTEEVDVVVTDLAQDATESNSERSERKIDIIVPAGKLGVVLDNNEDGPAYVSEVKETCPIKDQIRVGDKVVEIDYEDVSMKEAVDVSSEF